MLRVLLFRISLSWRNLLHNKQRFAAALFAVAFAVMLMFTQLAFRNGMLDSNVVLLRSLNADIMMFSPQRAILAMEATLPKSRLYQAQSLPEIVDAYPLYITLGTWKNEQTSLERVIRVAAFNLKDPVFLLPGVQEAIADLRQPDTVLADSKSWKGYGAMTKGVSTELSGRRIKVVGNFELGTDFVSYGNVIMSDQNFLRIFSEHFSGFSGQFRDSLEKVDVGLLKAAPGTDLNQLIKKLYKILPTGIKLYTKDDYVMKEIEFYSQATLGFVFTLGAVIGFIVGTLVVYNIIATDIKQNLAQYGTLRAIGHSNNYLLGIILLQSTLVAVLGFMPGVFASILVCEVLVGITGLLIKIKLGMGIFVFLATIGMCLLAGFIAARRLKTLDPADIYSQKL